MLSVNIIPVLIFYSCVYCVMKKAYCIPNAFMRRFLAMNVYPKKNEKTLL